MVFLKDLFPRTLLLKMVLIGTSQEGTILN